MPLKKPQQFSNFLPEPLDEMAISTVTVHCWYITWHGRNKTIVSHFLKLLFLYASLNTSYLPLRMWLLNHLKYDKMGKLRGYGIFLMMELNRINDNIN